MSKRVNKRVKYAVSNIVTPFIIFACLLGIFLALGNHITIVEGNSMEPTLKNGQICLSSSLKLNDIKRDDIIIVNSTKFGDILIKRIIGMPGEEVSCQNGIIYINGNKYDDLYANGYTNDFYVSLKEDEYFCLGDNREHSTDSRALGAFSKDEVVAVLVK